MSAVIELEHPVKEKEQTFDNLTMRRPKVRDQVAASKKTGTDAEIEVALFANLCEVAPETIEDLDMKDYKKVQAAYKGFLT